MLLTFRDAIASNKRLISKKDTVKMLKKLSLVCESWQQFIEQYVSSCILFVHVVKFDIRVLTTEMLCPGHQCPPVTLPMLPMLGLLPSHTANTIMHCLTLQYVIL